MTKEEAIALAEKRNAHKGKALAHKEWVPSEDNGAWSVKLIDSPSYQSKRASDEMADALSQAQSRRMIGESP